MILIVLIISLFGSDILISQNRDQNLEINSLINKSIKINKSNPYIEVLRVQVYSDDSKHKVTEVKESFSNAFPFKFFEMVYEEPYWKIYTGIFLDKASIYEQLQDIKDKFKDAVMVSESISIDKFNKQYGLDAD